MNIENPDLYRDHIVHYFDTQLGSDILNLPDEQKFKLFQMLTDYAGVLEKIFHPGIPILEHILGKPWAAAKANPHEGIDLEHDCEIIRQYEAWKSVR
jgi:hypothetical protein